MSTISRRQFLASTSLAAGTAVLAGNFTLAEQPAAVVAAKVKSGTDMVTLGKTGIKTIRVGHRHGHDRRQRSARPWARSICPPAPRGL